MNINTPIEVVFGDGKLLNLTLELEQWLDEHNLEVLGGIAHSHALARTHAHSLATCLLTNATLTYCTQIVRLPERSKD
jgi:hypothetical protein